MLRDPPPPHRHLAVTRDSPPPPFLPLSSLPALRMSGRKRALSDRKEETTREDSLRDGRGRIVPASCPEAAKWARREGGDDVMLRRLFDYLARDAVVAQSEPSCLAFSHSTDLTATVSAIVSKPVHDVFGRDRSDATARMLVFDEAALLASILDSDARRRRVFASIGSRHVQKTLTVAANRTTTTAVVSEREGGRVAVFDRYYVRMRVLTGFGTMAVVGELRLNEEIALADKTQYVGTHVNWTSWGFDAANKWKDGTGAAFRVGGYPF